MDNLEEKNKFLEMYSFPRLNQEEIEKYENNYQEWNWISKKNSSQVLQPRTTRLHTSHEFGEIYQICREKLTPIILKLSRKTTEEDNPSILIFQGQHLPKIKTRQRITKKEN